MEEYSINKTGYVMRYHDFTGEDVPILFIHGLGRAGSFDYPEVAAQDSLKNHRRILVDLSGVINVKRRKKRYTHVETSD